MEVAEIALKLNECVLLPSLLAVFLRQQLGGNRLTLSRADRLINRINAHRHTLSVFAEGMLTVGPNADYCRRV